MQQAESGTVHLITRNVTGTFMEAVHFEQSEMREVRHFPKESFQRHIVEQDGEKVRMFLVYPKNNFGLHAYVQARTHTHAHTHAHTRTLTRTHSHTHAHTHSHTHAHTRTHTLTHTHTTHTHTRTTPVLYLIVSITEA